MMFKLLGLAFAILLLPVSGLAAPPAVPLNDVDLLTRAAQAAGVSVVVKDAALGPAPLPGLKYAHVTNTVGPVFMDNTHYPVLVIAGYSYWAFSWTDSRTGLAILAYDSNNNLVGRWDSTDARFLFSIDYNSGNGNVVFTGQVGNTVTIPVVELLEPIVFMSTLNAATQPAAPSGLQYITQGGDNTRCPVLIVGAYTYWPLSYIDGRQSLNLVGYDRNKNLVGQVDVPGTRAILTIVYDPDTGAIELIGQSGPIVTISVVPLL
ncbi:hypothetical protein C8J57DRAFT_1378269 [Mycena rebaudengoi]|nr:hypothetical protein C8J57DRAFT_1378269 [Mycena rebaudengoi]